jgi:hypothetical protein
MSFFKLLQNFFVFLQNMDRRISYILLAVLIVVSLCVPKFRLFDQRPTATPEVRMAYNTIKNVKPGKAAIISIWWSGGTLAENRPQTEAVVRHCFARNIPVMILPFDLMGSTLAYNKVNEVAKEMHKEYGKDWVAFGYLPAADVTIQAIAGGAQGIWGALKKDRFGTPVSKIPMMQNIRKPTDIGVIAEFTPSGGSGFGIQSTVALWVQYLTQQYKIPIVYGPTGVMVPEGYNLLDAGQIQGMLPGLIGATKYEVLLKQEGFATRAARALSASHLLIILLIIIGNIGYLASRKETSKG